MRKKHQGSARFLRMKAVLLLNLAVFGFVAWGFGGEYVRNRDLQREMDGLQGAAASLEARNLELAALRERFASDGQMEREARLKLNLMRPGEQVVVIKDLGPRPQGAVEARNAERPAVAGQAPSNAQKWLMYLVRGIAPNNEDYSPQ